MPLKHSEAIVLRTYPLREADLLVTLFTRAEGKVKGVAKSAKRSQKRFGGALEPATCVRAQWQDREGQELARLDSCDVLLSPLAAPMDYPRAVALAHLTEMLDDLMPDREPNDTIFRLAWAVLQSLETSAIWMPVTYFDLWMIRLLGFLPPLDECIECGESLVAPAGSEAISAPPAFFHALRDGLTCQRDRRIASSEMSIESRALAARMFRNPVDAFTDEPVPTSRLADLRKFLMQIIDRHLDRKLQTSAQLERLD
jgi:DNA repair protein RecO (recombination protein O)